MKKPKPLHLSPGQQMAIFQDCYNFAAVNSNMGTEFYQED